MDARSAAPRGLLCRPVLICPQHLLMRTRPLMPPALAAGRCRFPFCRQSFPVQKKQQNRYGGPSSAEDQIDTKKDKLTFSKLDKPGLHKKTSVSWCYQWLRQSRKQTVKLGLLQLTPSGFNLLCLDWTVEKDLPDSPPGCRITLWVCKAKQVHKPFPGSSWKAFLRLALLEMGKNSWKLPARGWPP